MIMKISFSSKKPNVHSMKQVDLQLIFEGLVLLHGTALLFSSNIIVHPSHAL